MNFSLPDNAAPGAPPQQPLAPSSSSLPTSSGPAAAAAAAGAPPQAIPIILHAMQMLQQQQQQQGRVPGAIPGPPAASRPMMVMQQPHQPRQQHQQHQQPVALASASLPFEAVLAAAAKSNIDNGNKALKRERSLSSDSIEQPRSDARGDFKQPRIRGSAASPSGWGWMERVLEPSLGPSAEPRRPPAAVPESSRSSAALALLQKHQGDPLLSSVELLRTLQEAAGIYPPPSAQAPQAAAAAAPRAPTPEGPPPPIARSSRACSCRKSRCLKLYCDCFAKQIFCNNCGCSDCANHAGNEAEVRAAQMDVLRRDANAFQPKVDRSKFEHRDGCRCQKSRCLKKYCECFKSGVACSEHCRCEDCANTADGPGANPRGGAGAPTVRVIPPLAAAAADATTDAATADARAAAAVDAEEGAPHRAQQLLRMITTGSTKTGRLDDAGASDNKLRKLSVAPLLSLNAAAAQAAMAHQPPVAPGQQQGGGDGLRGSDRPQVALQSTSLQPASSEKSSEAGTPSESFKTPTSGLTSVEQEGAFLVRGLLEQLASGSLAPDSRHLLQLLGSQSKSGPQQPGSRGSADFHAAQMFLTPAPTDRQNLGNNMDARPVPRSEPPSFLSSVPGFAMVHQQQPAQTTPNAATTPLPATPAATLTGVSRRIAAAAAGAAGLHAAAWEDRTPKQDLVSPATAFLHKQGNLLDGLPPIPSGALQQVPTSSALHHSLDLPISREFLAANPLMGALRFDPY